MDSVKKNLNMLFYRKIAVFILSKACMKLSDLRAFFKLRNFSTVEILSEEKQARFYHILKDYVAKVYIDVFH